MQMIQTPIDERQFARLEKVAKSNNLTIQEMVAQIVKTRLDAEESIEVKHGEGC